MKVFKPLSLAVAVASASYVGMVNAQDLAAESGLGDLAIVPYYTVQAAWSTGISVINTSDATQVVKVRIRRAADSMDALDFNVVMSPEDVWTGYLQEAENGDIRWTTNDASCTVPALEEGGYLTMPDIYREGAETGYMEIIAMGSPEDEGQPIAVGALHDEDGIPEDCDSVRENFKRGRSADDYAANLTDLNALADQGGPRTEGVINSGLTFQPDITTLTNPNGLSTYVDSDDVLRVSYFIRDDDSGTEFGNAAVHIEGFMDGPSITNQRQGINEGDLQGFDHPNLDGGAPTSAIEGWGGGADFGEYITVRDALGASELVNDWSANESALFDVNTDWVVTTPGQYLMTRLAKYIDSLEPGGLECLPGNPANPPIDTDDGVINCDFRDIPLGIIATVVSREEALVVAESDDLVVSPAPPTTPEEVTFDREVNVIQWGAATVINADQVVIIEERPAGAFAGWASVAVEKWDGTEQAICEFTDWGTDIDESDAVCTPVGVDSPVPLVGFVAWERAFGDQPDANFGRIVEHARITD